MKASFLTMLQIAISVLPLLPLTGCFCGQFFRGTEDVVGVVISPINPTVLPGATQSFKATGTFGGNGGTGDVTLQTKWTSSDTSIATIDDTGLAKGIRYGGVTITGDCDCYKSETSLTVTSTAVTLTSLAVTPVNATLNIGLTQQFAATGTYSNGTSGDITSSAVWSSSDNSVATVNSAGLATGVTAGSVTISAASGDVSGQTTLMVQ